MGWGSGGGTGASLGALVVSSQVWVPAAGVSSLYLARVCSDSAAEGGWAQTQARTRDARVMTDTSHKKEGFKKCRSATFSIDGYSFTIGENFAPGAGPGVLAHHPVAVAVADSKRGGGGHGNLGWRVLAGGSSWKL